MNIYLMKQTGIVVYEEFDSCVVIAESEEAARNIHPLPEVVPVDGEWGTVNDEGDRFKHNCCDWVPYSKRNEISVTLIGIALEGKTSGVVCASFNPA